MAANNQVSVFDVAKYILQKTGPITAMKLQKLVYYSQAWSLVWDEAKLFNSKIEAWSNGAVIRELFDAHRGLFTVSEGTFLGADEKKLSKIQADTIDAVLLAYRDLTAQQLSDLNHQERPWLEARGNLPPLDKCTNEITVDSMMIYYSGIMADAQSRASE
jgi:uncharacterized phage-associated protein